tara:strand:- start:433 stop:588 length:156 start_codon:yes stop_codon:yes gene_type:complete
LDLALCPTYQASTYPLQQYETKWQASKPMATLLNLTQARDEYQQTPDTGIS